MELKLTTPIKIKGEEVTELQFDDPTTRIRLRVGGRPFRVNADGSVSIDELLVAKYICELAHINMIHVEQLSNADFTRIGNAIGAFFASDRWPTAQEMEEIS